MKILLQIRSIKCIKRAFVRVIFTKMKLFLIPNKVYFEVVFKFDKNIIDMIKQVNQCQFNPLLKKWFCHKDSIQILIDAAQAKNVDVIHAVDDWQDATTQKESNTDNKSISIQTDYQLQAKKLPDGSLLIPLPFSKEMYFKLKPFGNKIIHKDCWIIHDINKFNKFCFDKNIIIVTD